MTSKIILNSCKMSFCRLIKPPVVPPTHLSRLLHTSNMQCNKSIYKIKEVKKIRFYVLHRYVEYVKKYEQFMERKFPETMRIYKVFMIGIKEFIYDVKKFVKISRILNTKGQGYGSLTRKEIELYHQMPKDMRKVAPVLLLSALPFANYIIFPMAYLFPRHLLTSHFWNIQQKSEFNLVFLQYRLLNNKPVFRCLQEQLEFVEGHKAYETWAAIIAKLGSGVQPTELEVLACIDLFSGEPYHLYYLRGKHIKHLLKMHDMHTGWFRRVRLTERALIIREMDKAILREGGVHNLPADALRNACYLRGLNPMNMKHEDMVYWLRGWVHITAFVTRENVSLLLHLPVLLGYNQPSNWRLIYPDQVVK